MTTPTPDEQALTEQIAEAIRRATDEGASRTEDYARAVLPVVKTAQREAWGEGYSTAQAAELYAVDTTNPYEETTP